jgi:Tfp pilus assembly protein PilE
MIQIGKKNKRECGYAILELLFYIAFFVILSLVVINAMITMSKAFKETAIQAELSQSGTIMERMAREIRQASAINSISATDLTLSTKGVSGADTTMEFKLSGSSLQLLENGNFTGNLNPPNITITVLAFTSITTNQGKAVKIALTVKSTDDGLGRLQNFYDTIVLRGNY